MSDPEQAISSRTLVISRQTLPHRPLRTAAVISFLPALPLCIAHGSLSHSLVPGLGLLPLFMSASVSLYLLLVGGIRNTGKLKGKRKITATGESSSRRNMEYDDDAEETEVDREIQRLIDPEVEERTSKRDGSEEERDGEGEEGVRAVLTHRIFVFMVDISLAAAIMVVLVFTWIGTGTVSDDDRARPELVMLGAYATVPLLLNFLIHLSLAAREFIAGLAIPGLIEWTAWRAVPPDCPNCGIRLRPDELPPIPWYESLAMPRLSFPNIKPLYFKRPSLPSFRISTPKFPPLKNRQWRLPKWMRHHDEEETARLFVNEEQNEDPEHYQDDPEDGYGGHDSHSTTAVATGPVAAAPEEVIVGKKDKKAKSSVVASLLGHEAPWG